MSEIYADNKSPRTLSESCAEELLKLHEDLKLVRRPFNHYTPTMTDWYIVPSSELPFFKFNKFSFNWDERFCREILCGVILTKGLSPELSIVYTSKKGRRYIMDESWGFYKFMRSIEDGSWLNAAQKSSQLFGNLPIRLMIKGGYVDDPGIFDLDNDKRLKDIYQLDFDVMNDVIHLVKADRSAMTLKILNQAKNFATLQKALLQIRQDNFLWCDIFFGLPFQMIPEAERPMISGFTGAEITGKLLNNFIGLLSLK